MGMGTKTKKKGTGKKNSGQKSTPAFDVAKSLVKTEKLYDKLTLEMAKEYASAEYEDDIENLLFEYVVAARSRPGSTANPASSDWIPLAQLCVVRPIHSEEKDGEMDSSVAAAISYYCREIYHAACIASPSTFKGLPRNAVEYGVEPTDSFFKYVYEDVIQGKPSAGSIEEGGSTVVMTKAKAREVLGLEAGCADMASIKQAYRKMMFEHHPDRFVNQERTQEEKDASSNKFRSVKTAYEALSSGIRVSDSNGVARSWYESLGGKSRTEFVGPVELMSVDRAGDFCNKAFKAAICRIESEVPMAFVARNNQAAKR